MLPKITYYALRNIDVYKSLIYRSDTRNLVKLSDYDKWTHCSRAQHALLLTLSPSFALC